MRPDAHRLYSVPSFHLILAAGYPTFIPRSVDGTMLPSSNTLSPSRGNQSSPSPPCLTFTSIRISANAGLIHTRRIPTYCDDMAPHGIGKSQSHGHHGSWLLASVAPQSPVTGHRHRLTRYCFSTMHAPTLSFAPLPDRFGTAYNQSPPP
ncbi:hypothetical protein LY76DRAFT_313409 [Colletotrichum caudatum]|nr:hypothetical protein LY76DRAFT_313409 [Colletotrichum caudatum]